MPPPHLLPCSTGIWRDGGGNNQSPFYVTAAVARATGLPEDSLVAITTFGLKNHSGGVPHPYTNATLASFFAVGVAKNWTAPMVIRKQPLFKNPGVVVWEVHGLIRHAPRHIQLINRLSLPPNQLDAVAAGA